MGNLARISQRNTTPLKRLSRQTIQAKRQSTEYFSMDKIAIPDTIKLRK